MYNHSIESGAHLYVIHVEAWVRRGLIGHREKVTEAMFKFVAIDDEGNPTPVPALEDLPDYVQDDL